MSFAPPQTNLTQVLLVEDDEVDAEAIQRAFKKAGVVCPLLHVYDGVAALERLRGQDGEPPLERPYLILLDLNMPRMSGLEFLEAVRESSDLTDSVVFVLTTSDDDRDKLAAYKQHVAGYIVKSKAGTDFVEMIDMLNHYWRVIEMPPAKQS